MNYIRLPLFALVFALVTMGCDSDGTGDTGGPSGLTRGSSSIDVTGKYTESADGTGTASSTNLSPGWGIIMSASASGTTGFVIASDVGDRPSTGTYPIDNSSSSDLPAGTYRATLGINSEIFVGTSGTMTITESSDSEVKGSFSFDAVGVIDATSAVTVSGSFFSINIISTSDNRL